MTTKREETVLLDRIDINTLFKFIKPYDGSRDKLNSFLNNCENAYKLASSTQKSILLNFILSRLEGKAETAASIKDFDSWETLSSFLQSQFGERKHYAHLLSELQDAHQLTGESVSQYSIKIETCLAQILTEITLSNKKKTELSGKTSAMEDLALHSFLMGLTPKIGNLVRMKNPISLNEAINYAISEEKIQILLSKRNPYQNRSIQKPTNSYDRPRPNVVHNVAQSPVSSPPVCRYCKNIGHTIDICRKREYNNNRARNNTSLQRPDQSSNRSSQRPNFQNRVHYTQDNTNPSDALPLNE